MRVGWADKNNLDTSKRYLWRSKDAYGVGFPYRTKTSFYFIDKFGNQVMAEYIDEIGEVGTAIGKDEFLGRLSLLIREYEQGNNAEIGVNVYFVNGDGNWRCWDGTEFETKNLSVKEL